MTALEFSSKAGEHSSLPTAFVIFLICFRADTSVSRSNEMRLRITHTQEGPPLRRLQYIYTIQFKTVPIFYSTRVTFSLDKNSVPLSFFIQPLLILQGFLAYLHLIPFLSKYSMRIVALALLIMLAILNN